MEEGAVLKTIPEKRKVLQLKHCNIFDGLVILAEDVDVCSDELKSQVTF